MENDSMLKEMQEKINHLYAETFKNYSEDLNLSVPLIPRISEAYLKNRTVVIGQETNTWYRKSSDDLKNVFQKELNEIEKV